MREQFRTFRGLFFVAACCLLQACAGVDERLPGGEQLAEPLTPVPGDAARGRVIVIGRDANCLLCHSIPETGARFMGNLGPPLSGVGSRLSAGEIRSRVVDPTRMNPDAAMPSYFRVHGLDNVAEGYRGAPILSAQQIEDVIAYLLTLR